MTNTASILPLAHATVLRGQRAWTRIKSTAAEQRQLWRDIGEALRYGRSLHKADRAFSQWVNENGFGDIKPKTRSDAMWLAAGWSGIIPDLPAELTHPEGIRKWFNETQADTPPAPELTIEAPSRLTASIEQVAPVAHKVNKLAAMAERGEGQEKATAQKYLDKKAKEMGMETEELVNLSKKLEPAREVPPTMQPVLEENLKVLAEIVAELVDFVTSTQEGGTGDTPITKEFAISVILNTFKRQGV